MSVIPKTESSIDSASEQAEWFAGAIQPHESKLRAWLRSRFPKLSDVDDIVQETFLRIVRAKRDGKVAHEKSYMFATARNLAVDQFRRDRLVPFEKVADQADLSVLDEQPDAKDAADHNQRIDALREAIQALPERCREILILRKHHGLSYREIADRLGISINTVNAQITIATVKCREHFAARGLI